MRKAVIGVILLIIILTTGCSENEDISETPDNPYSREHIIYLSQSDSFGSRRSDDEILALKYLYDSKEVSQVYGDTFQISGDNIICHKSETESFFVLGFFRGEAVYEFILGENSYKISLTKSYFGNWTVDGFEQNDYAKED